MQILPEREVQLTEDLVLPARGSLFLRGYACSAQWHGTASSWRSSRVNSSTYNQGMWGIHHVGKKWRKEDSARRTKLKWFFCIRNLEKNIRKESWAWGDCRLLSEETAPFTLNEWDKDYLSIEEAHYITLACEISKLDQEKLPVSYQTHISFTVQFICCQAGVEISKMTCAIFSPFPREGPN